MTRNNDYQEMTKDPNFRKLLAVESLVAEAAELIGRLMAEKKVNKAALARRLNRSRAWVTQLLSGKTNMTIRTLAELAYALEAEIELATQAAAPANAGRDATRPGASIRLLNAQPIDSAPAWRARYVSQPLSEIPEGQQRSA
jgi:transcriptional regulator with XRE-family HTH domain